MKKISDSGFKNWTLDRLPQQKGKTFIITGGNSGIGFETAKILAKAGADVIITCRSEEKAAQAKAEISFIAKGNVDHVLMDLSSLASVRNAAEQIHQRYEKLDGLINNAGIMFPPKTTTEDGYELQFATNHLGHFLFTGLLFDLVEKASGRVVVTSSIAHKQGTINFDDLMANNDYRPMSVYSQSKLANLLFALELDRRLKTAGSKVICIACHPGYSATNLQSTGPQGFMKWILSLANKIAAQTPIQGATPTVLAAAGTEALAGAYYGPQSMGESKGPVSDAKVSDEARDEQVAKRLWEESEKLVGYQWAISAN